MTLLSQVKHGRIQRPVLAIIYGPDGVGKSTFAADAPSTIFLGPEKGTSNLDVARFPTPKVFEDVLTAITELTNESHDYKTLAIDSLDWIEPLCWETICAQEGVTNIEHVGGGYGKGYVAAIYLWRQLIHKLSRLQDERKMNIVLIAHSQVKTFQDPQTQGNYDRYQLKLNDKAAALFREFVECVLFANFEVFVKKDGSKMRAFGDGARIMFTERRPAFDAKNRLGLPFQLPLSWEDFAKAYEGGNPEDAAVILKDIQEILDQVNDPSLKEVITGTLEKIKDDSIHLNRLRDKLRARIAQ